MRATMSRSDFHCVSFQFSFHIRVNSLGTEYRLASQQYFAGCLITRSAGVSSEITLSRTLNDFENVTAILMDSYHRYISRPLQASVVICCLLI
jgi:hypothetical protein